MRRLLKQALPQPVTRILSGTENYAKRLFACAEIARTIHGTQSRDRKILRAALLRSPISMLADIHNWRELQLSDDVTVVAGNLGIFAIRARSDDLHHVIPSVNGAIMRILGEHLQPGDVAIDAGANIGAVSVFMAKAVTETGRVIAIEMMPDTAHQLRNNLLMNQLGWAEVIESALADEIGKRVVAEVVEGIYGQASIALKANPNQSVLRLELASTTLDTVTADIPRIAAIKIDLEGAEPLALAGATETLKRTRTVVFESWNSEGGETAGILADHGFAIAPIDGRNFIASK